MSCRTIADLDDGSRRRREGQRRGLALILQGPIAVIILLTALLPRARDGGGNKRERAF